MFHKYVEQLKPKPQFNLKWYDQKDLYSDGDVEEKIVQLIAENEPENYVKAIYDNYSWPVYYHLTHVRKNILNWYPFTKVDDILEIGCGFGAITGLLCDKCKSVTAVELSERRATGTLLRCREKENLEIIVGNLNDIEFDRRFDYITLIGVLEYQGRFTNSDNPYVDFLKKIRTLLKPNGKLLIAIENQYGLKYWCGAMEDHSGVPFDGINQYKFTNNGIRTFSRTGLENIIKKSGFGNTYFYYPLPDYKLPMVIYSENYLPQNGKLQDVKYYYAHQGVSLIASESEIYQDIIENNAFEFMANSFLVECSDSEQLGEVEFVSAASNRMREYQLGTKILKGHLVKKYSLWYEGQSHIAQTVLNEQKLRQRGLETIGSWYEEEQLVAPYSKAQTLETCVVQAIHERRFERVYAYIDAIYSDILKSSEHMDWKSNIIFAFQIDEPKNEEVYGPVLAEGYLDLTFRNAFWDNNRLCWFDQEWMLENIPAKYILFRAVGTLYYSFPDLDDILPLAELYDRYGMCDIVKQFSQLEDFFNKSIIDTMHMKEGYMLQHKDDQILVDNIKRLMKVQH